MAVIVIGKDAKTTSLAGLAGVCVKARGMGRRALRYVAATVLICAVGVALLQLVAQILSFPAPIAGIAITLLAGVLLNWLRRQLRHGKT
jgi:hypothetical protein